MEPADGEMARVPTTAVFSETQAQAAAVVVEEVRS
jgi:hypothetical protein